MNLDTEYKRWQVGEIDREEFFTYFLIRARELASRQKDEDIFQDAAMAFLETHEEISENKDTWLKRFIYNQGLNKWRREKKFVPLEDREEVEAGLDIDEKLLVESLLNRLPASDRAAIEDVYGFVGEPRDKTTDRYRRAEIALEKLRRLAHAKVGE